MTAQMVNLFSEVVTTYEPHARAAESSPAGAMAELEQRAAETTGQEAGLFVASGTMGNLVSTLAHCQPGDEVIIGAGAHTILYEGGGAARIAGIVWRPADEENGAVPPAQVMRLHRPEPTVLAGRTRVLWLENTFMVGGGKVIPLSVQDDLVATARQLDLRVHLDGARVFNAAVALDQPVARLTADADSVMFCLNKTLGAPMGALVCGPEEFINHARMHRQLLGGGAFHAPVGVAEAIQAISDYHLQLRLDHSRAEAIGAAVQECPGLLLAFPVETNIVMADITNPAVDAAWLVQLLRANGVVGWAIGPRRVRFTTHRALSDADIEHVVGVFARLAETCEVELAGDGDRGQRPAASIPAAGG